MRRSALEGARLKRRRLTEEARGSCWRSWAQQGRGLGEGGGGLSGGGGRGAAGGVWRRVLHFHLEGAEAETFTHLPFPKTHIRDQHI